jgi:KUP system potassium uptake protein
MHKTIARRIREVAKPLGIVFGDIGTSPIYTLTAILLFLRSHNDFTEATLMGIVSLIVWALIIIVYVQYTWLAMNLSMRGEGGTIILQEILVPLLKNKKRVSLVITISFVALSFIIGDGVITPAITILSAVEGFVLVPGLEKTPLYLILIVAIIITALLFGFQKKGTDRVSSYFSPIMTVWFISLAVTGIISIAHYPAILKALSPHYAVGFFIHHKFIGLLVLTEVILAVTGGEALYADMGHLGKQCIVNAWNVVFVCLVLNYMGQAAYVQLHPEAQSTLFEMVFYQSKIFYIFFVLLTVLASVIASQAMISAMFSIVYQGINTHIMPRLKVSHTSRELSTQIYISTVNWFLFVCVVLMLIIFQKSANMAVAYGMAVNVTMTLTAVMLIWIYWLKNEKLFAALSVMVACVDLTLLAANLTKLTHGGYISLICAAIPLSIILLYRAGQRRLYVALKPLAQNVFLNRYNEMYKTASKIHGTAIFLLRDAGHFSPYIVNTIFKHNILYEYNIILSISTKDKPFGIKAHFNESLAPSLRVFEIRVGYMEMVNIEEVLKDHGIDEKVTFYGIEDIVTDNIIWKAFAVIKALSPAIVQFYDLDPQKLHGVITQVKI